MNKDEFDMITGFPLSDQEVELDPLLKWASSKALELLRPVGDCLRVALLVL